MSKRTNHKMLQVRATTFSLLKQIQEHFNQKTGGKKSYDKIIDELIQKNKVNE